MKAELEHYRLDITLTPFRAILHVLKRVWPLSVKQYITFWVHCGD
jgi:hypothetical protein